ncbi:S9 family peptidase [Sinomicrobium weinanense]|uniref:S9 family peptidase n=1 Tax=Sinomicrobium weinanense TaxID=2842200 RepID=A0A926Q1P2_9FLAO|nr:S9 family peptidase [Sinomicrobium weinanense]MBC9794994.1 S9 family peptidase [Sinomicrobium weinanense]MBU3125145.1 S9 family peptidase [Sinomicrobium weinanense]
MGTVLLHGQQTDPLLTLDRIYNSSEFHTDSQRPVFWVENGDAFVTVEPSAEGEDQLIRYVSRNNKKSVYLSAAKITPEGEDRALSIEDFTLSPDETKVLIFTNSSRVWRSNTKGDYWVYDFNSGRLQQIGKDFPASSLMFAKFSDDNAFVAYVHDFNIYKEGFTTGQTTRLTEDGNGDIINGTFDWVYEEEFGTRDGFSWSPDAKKIAFWQLDASEIGTFYMINNTDSVYAKPVPLQYPKAGYDPSSARVGVIDVNSGEITWIPVPGDAVQHYLPAMQWVNDDLLLVQQLNRKQNELNIYTYRPSSQRLKKIYTETEDTWVDLKYPDLSSNQWGDNDLLLTDNNSAFLRMTENDGWRHIYRVDIDNGKQTLLTPGNFDVAAYYAMTEKDIYISASPDDPAQRYLYSVSLNGKGKIKRLTPETFSGVNTYNISPNGKYAIHDHTDAETPITTRLISLPGHKTISTLVDNSELKSKLKALELPSVEFFRVNTSEGVDVDGRVIKPAGFDPSKKYPVIFHVYGEPWKQMATDTWIGLYDIFLAQKDFIIVNLDNRGTPSLRGSAWRKSIYRKVGVLNTDDQALAAREVLQWDFIDKERVSVWGWSGGGSMTLNLMFRYPEVYKTGVAVAAVANQFFYDNVYQERYMGLPQENKEDFIEGSPVTYAKNLEGDLLIIHGTGDDNVHYQNMEYLVNELIRHNKQFRMMSYPNRSHHIDEGANTQRHLYTLITNYLLEKNGMDQ